jgi:glucose/arabinose dehydrogenase
MTEGKMTAAVFLLPGTLGLSGCHMTGRPVDVLTGPGGGLLISSDSGGFIYRVSHASE